MERGHQGRYLADFRARQTNLAASTSRHACVLELQALSEATVHDPSAQAPEREALTTALA